MKKPSPVLLAIVRVFLAVHVFVYRLTKGQVGGAIRGTPVLLLTTTGRKTGKQRTRPLGYFVQDSAYVIIGSNGGMDTHPAWVYNLKSHPRATVQLKDRQVEVRAEFAEADQRRQLWAQLLEVAPSYAAYTQTTQREIPVVILHPLKP